METYTKTEVIREKLLAEVNIMRTLLGEHEINEEFLAKDVYSNIKLLDEKKSLFQRINDLRDKDSLTGTLKKEVIRHQLQEEITRNHYKEQTSVVFLDIDNFKLFNDTNGHNAGDKLLSSVATDLKNHTHCGDFVGRYGGEEFLVILRDTDIFGAVQAANRLSLDFIESKKLAKQYEFDLTLSMGVAENNHDTPESLTDKADMAMYFAKKNGKNAIGVYHNDLEYLFVQPNMINDISIMNKDLWFDLEVIKGSTIANRFLADLTNNYTVEFLSPEVLFDPFNISQQKGEIFQYLDLIRQVKKGTIKLTKSKENISSLRDYSFSSS